MRSERVEAFWSYVDKTDDCWIWKAGCDGDGYGVFWTGEAHVRAHRVSWNLAFGATSSDVLHHCDNRRCVRPEHLFTGDNTSNVADMVSKGRQAKGEDNGRSKLDREQIEEALALSRSGSSGRSIARHFGVNESTVRRALAGKTWRQEDPSALARA